MPIMNIMLNNLPIKHIMLIISAYADAYQAYYYLIMIPVIKPILRITKLIMVVMHKIMLIKQNYRFIGHR